MRYSNAGAARLAMFFAVLFVTACSGAGDNVDKEAPSFVDTGTPTGIQTPTDDVGVVGQADPAFTPPPNNVSVNATISLDEKKQWIGRDLVKVWVWNERGSQQLLMAEGTGVSIPALKVNVEVAIVGPEEGGETILIVNGQKSKVLNEKEEQKIGNTYVFVSDIFLSSPQ